MASGDWEEPTLKELLQLEREKSRVLYAQVVELSRRVKEYKLEVETLENNIQYPKG